MTVVAQKGDD